MDEAQRKEWFRLRSTTDIFTAAAMMAPSLPTAEADELRRDAQNTVIDYLAEMRSELKRLEGVFQRMEHAARSAQTGAPAAAMAFANQLPPLDGWIFSLLESYMELYKLFRPKEVEGKVARLSSALRVGAMTDAYRWDTPEQKAFLRR